MYFEFTWQISVSYQLLLLLLLLLLFTAIEFSLGGIIPYPSDKQE